jgi:hypothetical protein
MPSVVIMNFHPKACPHQDRSQGLDAEVSIHKEKTSGGFAADLFFDGTDVQSGVSSNLGNR